MKCNFINLKNSVLKSVVILFCSLFVFTALGCSFVLDRVGGENDNYYEPEYGDDSNIFPDETTNLLINEKFENTLNFKTGRFEGTGRITKDNVFTKVNHNDTRARGILRDWSHHRNVYELQSNTSLSLNVTILEPSVLSFDYKSDMYDDNVMSVFIDNKLLSSFRCGGNGKTWSRTSIKLSAGKHTVKWNIPQQRRYSPQLENVIYIDNITITKDEAAFIDIYPKGLQETYVNGDPIQFNAKALRGDRSIIEDANINYSVSGCGTIDNNGKFTPTGTGTCTVTASYGGKSATNTTVTVHGKDYLSDPVKIAGYTFTGIQNYGTPLETTNIHFDKPMPSSADGFFVLQGHSSVPFFVKIIKKTNGQSTSSPLETTFFVRNPGEFYKRIWLRFGAGSYDVFISEISELNIYNPEYGYDGDIKGYSYYRSGPNTCQFNVINTNNSLSEEDATWLMPSEVVQSDSFIVSNVYNNIMAGIINPGKGDKLRLIHDWELYNFYYDMASVNHDGIYRKRQDSEHVIRYGTGVCEGYANLYAALVRSAGIPASVICEREKLLHAWNHVKYNNNWYLVDVTWDDPVTDNSDSYNDISAGRELYTYFMTAHTDNKHTLPGVADTKRSSIENSEDNTKVAPKMTGMPDGWY